MTSCEDGLLSPIDPFDVHVDVKAVLPDSTEYIAPDGTRRYGGVFCRIVLTAMAVGSSGRYALWHSGRTYLLTDSLRAFVTPPGPWSADEVAAIWGGTEGIRAGDEIKSDTITEGRGEYLFIFRLRDAATEEIFVTEETYVDCATGKQRPA